MTANPAPYLTQPEEPPSVQPTIRSMTAAAATLERSVVALKGRQHHDGWWKGELETNVTMDAEDLLLRQFLGIRTERQTAAAATWIRSRQREDGTWATYYGGPPDLSTSIEAYVALRLAGDGVDDPHMRRASTYIREAGGIGASRVFTRIWLALFGQWPWERLPVMPPELMLLPPSVPLNIYDFACWARQTVVALTVISAHRPVRDALGRHRGVGRGPRPGHAPPAHHLGRTVRPSRPVPPRLRATTAPRPAPILARRGRTLDPQAPGGGRLLGGHPATVGLLAHGLAPAGLCPGPPGDAGRARRPGRVHHRRRRRAAHRGLPVARVGYRARGRGPRRCRRCARRSGAAVRPDAGWCTRRSRSRGTGPYDVPTLPPVAGPSSSPTTTTPTSTTRLRWRSPCGGRRSPTMERWRGPSTGPWACSVEMEDGARSTSTTHGRSAGSCPSATSAS